MLAVVTHGPRDYRIEEWPVPDPAPGEAIIEVGAVGICSSDMKCYLDGPRFWGVDDAGEYVEGPVIAGLEDAGMVAALGKDAAGKLTSEMHPLTDFHTAMNQALTGDVLKAFITPDR